MNAPVGLSLPVLAQVMNRFRYVLLVLAMGQNNPDRIQCCVKGASDGGGSSSGTGAGIVSAATKKEGLPYVWAGGGCDGPSKGGFDCSGAFPAIRTWPL